MARPADLLAIVAKANARRARAEKASAKHHELLAKQHQFLAHVARLAPQLDREQTEDVRQVIAEQRKFRHMFVEHRRRMAKTIRAAELAVIRGRLNRSRSECSGARSRASRAKPVRRRGSRRTPAATRAGPEAGDPEPAGFGAPVGDTSRVDALAGRLA